MRKLVYYVGASVDGYIAGPDGQFDFYQPPEDLLAAFVEERPEVIPSHVRPFMGVEDAVNKQWDTVVMGRGTYQPALDQGIASPYSHMRQYVVSSTLDPAIDPAVEVVESDPAALVSRLKEEESPLDIWLAGGGKLAASLFPEIDEIILKQYPVVLGGGIPLFQGAYAPTVFAVADVREFSEGIRVVRYVRS